jgi:membrane protease subunit HflK
MAHDHQHGHQHDHAHAHHLHEQTPPESDRAFDASMDPAQRSLSQALRLSFRVLSVLMVFVLGVFLATGFEEVPSGHVGLVKVFGKIVDTAEPGIAFTWPFPIGEVETIYVEPRTMTMENFWPSVSAADLAATGGSLKGVDLGTQGLRPGLDGALLTGDRSLYMVTLDVTWEVTDARAFATRLRSPEESIRQFVAEAAVRAAAGRTAESIRRDVSPDAEAAGTVDERLGQRSFSSQIRQYAQAHLDRIGSGVRITQVTIPMYSWHPAAWNAYEQAQRRFQEMDTRISRARRDASEQLRQAAGTAYVQLVGEPGSPTQRPADYPEDQPYNLVGQYNLARDAGDLDRAEEILQRIDRVLQSASLGGEARKIIAEAESYRTGVEQAVQQRANRFQALLETYKNPETRDMLIARLWLSTHEEIFSRDQIERIILSNSREPFRVIVPRSPAAVKEIREAQTKADQEQ